MRFKPLLFIIESVLLDVVLSWGSFLTHKVYPSTKGWNDSMMYSFGNSAGFLIFEVLDPLKEPSRSSIKERASFKFKKNRSRLCNISSWTWIKELPFTDLTAYKQYLVKQSAINSEYNLN